eukprot:scaffold1452_cov117-Isochrysis_galbana.AAC.14
MSRNLRSSGNLVGPRPWPGSPPRQAPRPQVEYGRHPQRGAASALRSSRPLPWRPGAAAEAVKAATRGAGLLYREIAAEVGGEGVAPGSDGAAQSGTRCGDGAEVESLRMHAAVSAAAAAAAAALVCCAVGYRWAMRREKAGVSAADISKSTASSPEADGEGGGRRMCIVAPARRSVEQGSDCGCISNMAGGGACVATDASPPGEMAEGRHAILRLDGVSGGRCEPGKAGRSSPHVRVGHGLDAAHPDTDERYLRGFGVALAE